VSISHPIRQCSYSGPAPPPTDDWCVEEAQRTLRGYPGELKELTAPGRKWERRKSWCYIGLLLTTLSLLRLACSTLKEVESNDKAHRQGQSGSGESDARESFAPARTGGGIPSGCTPRSSDSSKRCRSTWETTFRWDNSSRRVQFGGVFDHGERRRAQWKPTAGYSAIRQIATVPGASVPPPFGGRYRQIMVYVDALKLEAYQMSPMDVVRAVNDSNLILPAGSVQIGSLDCSIYTNSQLRNARTKLQGKWGSSTNRISWSSFDSRNGSIFFRRNCSC
jgi:hypothetical protein